MEKIEIIVKQSGKQGKITITDTPKGLNIKTTFGLGGLKDLSGTNIESVLVSILEAFTKDS